jgi:diguanylate cyclase (GGDEF)-like protein
VAATDDQNIGLPIVEAFRNGHRVAFYSTFRAALATIYVGYTGALVPDEHDFDEAHEQTVVFERRDLVEAVSAPMSGRSHVFVRMDGSDVGQVTSLTGMMLEVGRLAKNHLHLPLEGVSRLHARIVYQDNAYWVEDLGSANGTFVQGARVTRHRLTDGDVVQFGPRVVFRYSITDTGEERILRQLYESSVKDALTGAFNREYFNERLKAEVAYARRHQADLSLVLFDIDHFKKINDTHGHPTGDAVLLTMANAIGKTLRAEDVLARYGGEEFGVVLRGVGLESAHGVGERLRGIAEATSTVHEGNAVRCTISAGCAALSCCENPSTEALIAIADRRLYIAKRGGRNRVVSTG